MTMDEMIYQCKSCRSFTKVPVDAASIEKIKVLVGMRYELTK